MNPLKKLAGETALYGLSSMLGRFLNYALVPIHTAVFPEGNYGILTEIYIYIAFLAVVYTFGIETAYFRHVNKFSNREESIFSHAFISVLGISLLVSIPVLAADTWLVNQMNYQGQEVFIWMMVGILFTDSIQAIPYARIRHEKKAILFAKGRLLGISINIFTNSLSISKTFLLIP